MLSKHLAYGLALAAGLALTSTASADDVIRLALPSSSGDVMTLGGTSADFDADTLTVHRYGGFRGGWGGGFRGGWVGGYRGFYGGGFRGGWVGGYRGFYGGFYRPFFYSSFYYPRFYGVYSYSYFPCSDDGGADVYAICGRRYVSSATYYYGQPAYYYAEPSYQPQPSYQPRPNNQPAPQVMPRADDTYPYDGGPKTPVPMPNEMQEPPDAKPTVIPYGKLQKGEVFVSLKPKQTQEKKTGKWEYPAYGEKATRK